VSSKIEQALATLKTNLQALSDCTVQRNYDQPVPWITLTTGRWINLKDGSFVPYSRLGQTIWLLTPVLELGVQDPDPNALGTKLTTLHEEVVAMIGADQHLGGAAAYCEPSEEQPTETGAADSPGEPAGAMVLPLTIAVATAAGSVAA
jgi:hypothetical protein